MVFGLEALVAIALSYGYAGGFAIGFLSSFTLFIPSPAFLAVLALATVLNPFLLGISVGLGSAVGEMTGYGIGFGFHLWSKKKAKGKKPQSKKLHAQLDYVRGLFKRHHPDLVIFVFAALPILPIDALGIFCGAVKYPAKRFFAFVLVGKIIKFTLLALAGFYGVGFVQGLFDFG